MLHLHTTRRAVALGAAGLALTASPALARPDVPLSRAVPAPSTPVTSVDLRSPDAQDAATAAARTTSSLAGTTSATVTRPPVVSSVKVVKADDGLDWGSAGIGAGTAIGALALIGLAGVAVGRRQRVHPVR